MACGCSKPRQFIPIITDPFGIEWEGYPGWVRFSSWMVHVFRGGDTELAVWWKKWPGCGCSKRLKGWYNAIARRFTWPDTTRA